MIPLCDEAVEGRVYDGAGGDGFRSGVCCLGLRDGGLRVGNLPLGVLHFLPSRDAALEEILRPCLVGGGIGERGLRPFDFRGLLLDFSRRARNLEAHEHVTTLDAFAFAEMNLGDTGGLGRDHDQLRSWCRSDQAGGTDDAANRALLRSDGANRDDCLALHFFRRRLRACARAECG